MRIQTVELAEKLIEEQFDQLEYTYELLKILSQRNVSKDSEKLAIRIHALETNMKYYCFLMSSFCDLMVILKGFINSKSRWEEIFYSKKGYLIIYESINTYNQNQKNIRDVISNNFPELEKVNLEVNQKLKTFKKTYSYHVEIAKIRNETAGHYNVDFNIYYPILEKLEKTKSIEAVENFILFLMSVINLVQKITSSLQSLPS